MLVDYNSSKQKKNVSSLRYIIYNSSIGLKLKCSFGLVSSFNGISNFIGYSIPKVSL